MNIEEVRSYSLTYKGAIESFPFDDTTLVVKVGGKIFILVNLEGERSINLKCDPDQAIELRETYPAIVPGYHMNKRHWNTVYLDGSLPDDLICKMIGDSYQLVLQSLPGKIRSEIEQINI